MYFSFSPTFCAIYRWQARKFMQEASQSLGARIGDAVVSAVSPDQRLARSTQPHCVKDNTRYIPWAYPDQPGYEL
jgi:hypothetical protein